MLTVGQTWITESDIANHMLSERMTRDEVIEQLRSIPGGEDIQILTDAEAADRKWAAEYKAFLQNLTVEHVLELFAEAKVEELVGDGSSYAAPAAMEFAAKKAAVLKDEIVRRATR